MSRAAGRDSHRGYALPTADQFPPHIRLSAHADQYLDRLADALTLKVFGLERLSGGLLAFALAVDTASREELNRAASRVGRLEYERDRLYWLVANPGKTGAGYYAATTAELWRLGGAA